MGERVSFWFGVVLVGIVLATSYWYAQTLRGGPAVNPGRIGAIDFFAEGVALTGFDDLGRARYRLFADGMRHYGSSDDVDMTQPRLVSMRPDQPQVQVTARTARALNNAQTVHMQGDVVVTRAADGVHPPLRFETDDLLAAPDDDHLWTSAPVLMQSGGAVLHARGMDYNNVTRRVELLADVAGTYPARRRP